MAYFSNGVTKDKLTMLFFLHELALEATRDQIVTVGLQCEILPYFEMQSVITELEEVGAIAAVQRSFGQAYCVTPLGEEILQFFQEELPLSLRKTLSMHAEENRQAMKYQTQYASLITDLPNGTCLTTFRARERDHEFLNLTIMLPDRETAENAREHWRERAPGVYRAIMEKLVE